ncbi:MAG: phosphoribosylformylglycinamidine synthase subunit PurL, partial [Methermicoccaceae archaeon]
MTVSDAQDMSDRAEGTEGKILLSKEDYEALCNALGRAPNLTEQGCFLNLWSEHCAYRSSTECLKTLPTTGDDVLIGPGDDAAVVSLDDETVLIIGMESHNHPSYVEPHDGAATGVGGIVRDIISMGGRPIALMDPLYFGPLSSSKNRYLFEHVVAGIGDYGNCIGVPVVRGEVFFDRGYSGNPLVNVVCVGLAPRQRVVTGRSKKAGNSVMLIGSRTGRDGLGGASFASRDLSSSPEEDRPSVQIGDPYTEKLLIEATLEAIEMGIVESCKDLGAAGLTGASSELAASGGHGIHITADNVPLREEGLTTYEILLAESQERMILEVKPEDEGIIHEIAKKYDINCAKIGVLSDDGKFLVEHGGEVVVDIPIDLLAGGAPSFTRTPEEKKREVEEFVSTPIEKLKDVWLRVLSSENIAHKQWVYSQYDHEVQVRTHVKPGHDAAVLVLDPHVIALSCGCNPRHVGFSPYEGTKLSVLENVTNLACMGASPFCAVNCLNFGNPEDNKVYWEFSEAVRGLGDMCRTLNVPVVGGNVSFYNESEELGTEVLPTPSLGIVGRLNDEFSKMILSGNASLPSPRAKKNETLLLIGNTYEEMGGSEYSSIVGGGGTPPVF